MKHVIETAGAVALCLIVSGCNKAHDTVPPAKTETVMNSDGTPATAAEQLAKVEVEKLHEKQAARDKAMAGRKLAEVTHFTALGTEPFWNFDLNGTAAKYTTPENEAGTAFTVTRTDSAQGTVFQGAMGKQRVRLLITPQQCSDGMSDRNHAYTVKGMIDDKELNGCANPV